MVRLTAKCGSQSLRLRLICVEAAPATIMRGWQVLDRGQSILLDMICEAATACAENLELMGSLIK